MTLRALLTLSLLAFGCDDGESDAWRLRDEEIGATSLGLSKCMGGTVGQSDYCTQAGCACLAGEGDCDTNAQCDQTVQAQVCGLNNGAKYGRGGGEDVCWPPHCQNGVLDGDETALDCGGACGSVCVCSTGSNGDGEFCTPSCKCGVGEGDCDTLSDCEQSPVPLICANNIGAKFGQIATNDLCVPAHCVNGAADGDETGLNCGGSCGTCPSTAYARANVDSAGNESNARVQLGYDVTPDGRFVVFASEATNLVAGDANAVTDVFRHDRSTGATIRVSTSATGVEANGDCFVASVSDDGRFVAFLSSASNLVTGDTNGFDDVFVKDVQSGAITRVSVRGATQANGASSEPHISGTGAYVVYTSAATNLIAGDTNGFDDIFLSNRQATSTIRASVGPSGAQPNNLSLNPHLDRNGRFIVFASRATNLVTADLNGFSDIFMYDRTAATTVRVSVGPTSTEPNQSSVSPFIVGAAGYIVYRSFASNLVTGDTNGTWDLFRVQRTTLATARVNVSTAGTQGDASSASAFADDSGRYVAFTTAATTMIAGDTNGVADCFLRDMTANTTVRIDNGSAPDGRSQDPVVAGGGGFVIFRSEATNQVVGDTNAVFDLFIAPRP
jgi:hypothetical protein